jgi:hypothetical protein
VADCGACFQHGRFETALEKVGCCGKADGAGTDDCD